MILRSSGPNSPENIRSMPLQLGNVNIVENWVKIKNLKTNLFLLQQGKPDFPTKFNVYFMLFTHTHTPL